MLLRATFVGLMYGYATILSSSMIVPMASHAVNNLVGGLLWRYESSSSNQKWENYYLLDLLAMNRWRTWISSYEDALSYSVVQSCFVYMPDMLIPISLCKRGLILSPKKALSTERHVQKSWTIYRDMFLQTKPAVPMKLCTTKSQSWFSSHLYVTFVFNKILNIFFHFHHP